MSEYGFLALDIDGTVVNSKKEITSVVKGEINRIQEAGVPVALVSGRPTKGIEHVAAELDFDKYESYILAFNGGKIIECSSGKVVYNQTIPLSLSKEVCKAAVEYAVEKFGRLDILVNNAGVAPLERNDILQMTAESMDRLLDINLKGTFFLTQYASNRMIENACGEAIINVTSMSAYTASINRGEYCISKAGVSMKIGVKVWIYKGEILPARKNKGGKKDVNSKEN